MKIVNDLTVTTRRHHPRSAMPQPGLRLDFVNGVYQPGGFGSVIAVSRAGAARYHDAFGVMQVAPVDTPRIDHARGSGVCRGLLIEAARTNLLLQSETPAAQSVTVTAQLYSLSFWGAGNIALSGAHAATLTGTGPNTRAVLVFAPGAGALAITVSGAVQMVQLEAGNCATSYIPTTTTPATRAADNVVMTLGSWWNPVEGSLWVEWQDINQQSGNTRIVGMPGSRTALSLTAGTGMGGNNAVRLEMWNGASALSVAPPVFDITKGIQSGVAAYSPSGRSVAVRGTLSTSPDPLLNTGNPAELYLGHQGGGGQSINGCVQRVVYYPKRLTDPQLLSLVP